MKKNSSNLRETLSIVFILSIITILVCYILFGLGNNVSFKFFSSKNDHVDNNHNSNDDNNYSINSLLLDYNIGNIVVGDRLGLKLVGYPSDKYAELKWDSSDTNIATVDINGVVNAIGVGSTVISVSNGITSDSVTINVKEKIDVSLIEIKYDIVSINQDKSVFFNIIVNNQSNIDISYLTFYINLPSGIIYNLPVSINEFNNLFVINDRIIAHGKRVYSCTMHLPDDTDIEYSNPEIIVQSVK